MLGGTNVQASAPEAREVLERGVADAITFPWQSTILFGIDKVVKYDMDMPFWTATFVWVMNKDRYDVDVAGAADGDRPSLHDRMGREGRRPVGGLGTRRPARMAAEPGHDVYKLTPEQVAAWRKAAEPLKAKWAAHVQNADKVFSDLQAELKKRDALVQ